MALLAALAVICAFSLFNHPLVPSMEPRFAEAVREMAQSGRWLAPIKNGVPYIEYPPLYFWLGLMGKMAGLPEPAAVRLPALLALLAWVWAMARLGRLLLPQWPEWLAPLVGAALPIVLGNFFLAQTDGLLALGVLIALCGHAEARLGKIAPGKFPWRLWLGAALALAAKGPVGLAIIGLTMGGELLLAAVSSVGKGPGGGGWKALWNDSMRLRPLSGLALALGLNAPWYFATGLSLGWEFCRAVLVYQNFTRFTVGFDHLQPAWYYLKTIWGDFFPLSLILPFALPPLWRRRAELPARLALSWTILPAIFFSISHAKQGKYLLPLAPGIVLGVLWALSWWRRGREPYARARMQRWLARWSVAVLALFAIGLIFVLPFFTGKIGDSAAYAKIRAEIQARPGKLFAYRWPRSAMLYELGHPLPWLRDPRALYGELANGGMKPGDYLLLDGKHLPPPAGRGDSPTLTPAPAPPFFILVLDLRARPGKPGLLLYRVTGEAPLQRPPPTAAPEPVQWWEKFDTD